MRPAKIKRDFCRCLKWILAAIFATVLYNEMFIYWVDTWSWPRVSCEAGVMSNSSCETALIVADPQILGRRTEPAGFLGFLTATDSDMYLTRSFLLAVRHTKPDIIIFLGDLMNEGSASTEEEYQQFKERFNKIFDTSHLKAEVIFVPGDNDIGGEGVDLLTDAKIERFTKNFPTPKETLSKTSHFILVNRMLASKDPTSRNFAVPPTDDKRSRVVLSHIPLTFTEGIIAREVMAQLKPDAVFSAHSHQFAIATSHWDPYSLSVSAEDGSKTVLTRLGPSGQGCVEVIWPTCSYRMGVAKAGYGIASIDSEGKMQVGVLWLHSRFTVLLSYLVVVSCVLTFSCLCSRYRRS